MRRKAMKVTYEELIEYYQNSAFDWQVMENKLRAELLKANPKMTNREATEINLRCMIDNEP